MDEGDRVGTGLSREMAKVTLNSPGDLLDDLFDEEDDKDGSKKLEELVKLTAHIIEYLPDRVRKPCADMLLIWESNKGNFHVSCHACVESFVHCH